MVYKKIVLEVLRRCLALDFKPGKRKINLIEGQDSEISTLIHDVFGGEILKTHKEKGWHFYNMIDGQRVDFTLADSDRSSDEIKFEDIPSNSFETSVYFDRCDYSAFFMKFVKTFEETIGLGQYSTGISA